MSVPIRLVALFICSCIWADLTACRKDSIFSFFYTILLIILPLLLFVAPKAFFVSSINYKLYRKVT